MTEENIQEEVLLKFKQMQKASWGLFAPLEIVTTMPASALVKFSEVKSTDTILDVGCGTGVVAITAARLNATVSGLDLCPALIERARENANMADVGIDFQEGDVEALPFKNDSFDVVLSQFGHMFAPRPKIAIQEMLRVLKPGGTIAFSTWPPDLYVGRLFSLVAKYSPTPEGVSPSSLWGNPHFVRDQLGDTVVDLIFDQGIMQFPALSLGHYCHSIETTLGPVLKLVEEAKNDPTTLNQFRQDLKALVSPYFRDNHIRQHYLMSRAKKK